MNKLTPIKQDDGKETVTLYGQTFDVTDAKELRAFKTDYTIDRSAQKKTTKSSKSDKQDETIKSE